jgi:NAD(P)-dependent dehydrogenase (short-subunit alcohol dehydrogenase family)
MWTKNNMPDQTGKTVIVTGANAGIGFETALAFYEKGANVILTCRSLEKSEQTLQKMQQQPGAGTLETAVLDLSSLALVKQFAGDFIQKHRQLHLLINNAGVMIPPASKTTEGYELQFGVNFLGHFAVTGYLYPLLNATPGSRVVTLSSLAYLRGVIDFDNLRSEKDYEPMREYSQSKLADLIFSIELQRRIIVSGGQTMSVAAQPGANKTELARHMSEEAHRAAVARVGELMEPWQGALPSLYAATSGKAIGGRLYGPDKDGGYRGYPAEAIITPNALDESVTQRLWDFAEQATGVYYPAP